ncbi:hypothetical protein AX16_002326 [Volvariella volvacea WC 439]|nr:hypothetical protein AX16_002326 [Volvariella volvacea WC 439]
MQLFLLCILLPPLSEVHIDASFIGSQYRVIFPFFRRIGKTENHEQVAFLSHLSVAARNTVHFQLEVQANVDPGPEPYSGAGPGRITFLLSTCNDPTFSRKILMRLLLLMLDSLPTQQLRSLTLTNLPFHKAHLREAFASLGVVEKMAFINGRLPVDLDPLPSSAFIDALRLAPPEKGHQIGGSAWFQHLKSLTLEHQLTHNDFASLCTVLESREARGYSLESLVLTSLSEGLGQAVVVEFCQKLGISLTVKSHTA